MKQRLSEVLAFWAHVLRLVFNEADTNYTICDINVTNCYSKIIYINIEDKAFLAQLTGTNSINLAAALLYDTPLFIRHLESAYSTMYDRCQ